jgi:hypothetical protein
MTAKTSIPGNDTGLPDYNDDDTKTRLLQVAEWLDLDVPPISYEDGSILLDDALLSWCNAGGVSLDWVFCGSAKLMAIAYQREFERERPFYEMLKGFDAVEQGFLLDALKAERAGKVSLEDALGVFKGKVEEHRASA